MATYFCTQCGKETSNTMKFCGNCGFELAKTAAEPADEVAAAAVSEAPTSKMESEPLSAQSGLVTVEGLTLFVGKKTYLEKFGLLDPKTEKIRKSSWNWAAFVFGTFWMAYRKMYLYSFILFVVQVLIPEVLSLTIGRDIPAYNGVETIFNAILFLVIGSYGNLIYYTHAKKKILSIKSKDPQLTGQLLHNKIQQVGGTSVLMVIIYIIIFGLSSWFFSVQS